MSRIQWTNRTWNPVRGCTVVSPGCKNCYAMRLAHRFSGEGQAYEGLTRMGARGPRWAGKARFVGKSLLLPMSWQAPQRVFVASMADPFHKDITDAQLDLIFMVMAACPRHQFQLLTKRAQRMRDYARARRPLPLSNVWLGCSVEDQRRCDERIPMLRATPAVVRFLSVEPLLERVALDLTGIHWVIIGGESEHGSRARPCDVGWIESVVEQCKAAGVPVFVKQLGSNPRGWARTPDYKGGNPKDWPRHLRVREYPQQLAKKKEGRHAAVA